MKIIHFADFHLGVETMGTVDPDTGMNDRVLDYLDTLDALIEFAEAEDVDLIIFAGDAFHRYNPHPMYLNAFSQRVIRMRQQCPIVLLVGNHDMAPATNAIQIYKSLQLDGIVIGDHYEVQVLETKAGKIQVGLAPYPTKRLFAKCQDLRKAANKAIYKLGDGISDDMPSILVGHFTVTNAQFGSERGYAIGTDAEIDLESIADPVWDYVALGHIHFRQVLSDQPPVIYAGSLERVSFNEENEDKGFMFIQIDNQHNVEYEFIQLDARPYVTIKIHTLKRHITEKVLKAISETDIQGAIVRIQMKIREEYRELVDVNSIYAALEEAGAKYIQGLSYQYIITSEDRSRVPYTTFNSSMLPIDLVASFLDIRGIDQKEQKHLLNMAADIINGGNSGQG